ncbi:MAG: hypothetical protein GY792_11060 [Gammaproteobacteria bacterium]|nr:hypothetical protein [Gammaproteobacteria bacterium]
MNRRGKAERGVVHQGGFPDSFDGNVWIAAYREKRLIAGVDPKQTPEPLPPNVP